MAGKTIHAAGGIVVRNGARPLIAIVPRATDELWVLPRGKLKRDESPLAGARREVVEKRTAFVCGIRRCITPCARSPEGRVLACRLKPTRPTSEYIMVKWLPPPWPFGLSYPLESLFSGMSANILRSPQPRRRPQIESRRRASKRRRGIAGAQPADWRRFAGDDAAACLGACHPERARSK
jgi:8-oxo-dGTP diphosphatase